MKKGAESQIGDVRRVVVIDEFGEPVYRHVPEPKKDTKSIGLLAKVVGICIAARLGTVFTDIPYAASIAMIAAEESAFGFIGKAQSYACGIIDNYIKRTTPPKDLPDTQKAAEIIGALCVMIGSISTNSRLFIGGSLAYAIIKATFGIKNIIQNQGNSPQR